MTQADNRTELLAELRRALRRQSRTGSLVGILFVDVDGLKAVNDSLGHAAGDRLIVRVADALRSQVRQDDHVARAGGDEFVAALVGLRGVADAEVIAAKIHRALNEPFDVDGRAVKSSVSIGIAMAKEGEDVEHLLGRADRAMYEAKQLGRDATVVYGDSPMGE